MTATIDIPDPLYRKIEAKTTALGRRVDEVTLELFEQWLADKGDPIRSEKQNDALAWLDEWTSMGRAACKDLPAGPTGRELMQQDRQRLDMPSPFPETI